MERNRPGVTATRRERWKAWNIRARDRQMAVLWPAIRLVIAPLLAAFVLVISIADVGPAWSAFLGGGTHGTFTAQQCQTNRAGCFWRGTFVADNGLDRRDDVGLGSGNSVSHVGQHVAARDTGDRADVYPADGGWDWIFTAALIPLPVAALGYWVAKVPVAALRDRRRRAA